MAIQLAFDFWGSTSPETKAAAESDRFHSCRFEVIARMIHVRYPFCFVKCREFSKLSHLIRVISGRHSLRVCWHVNVFDGPRNLKIAEESFE